VLGKDKKLKDHIIICGLGATALHIIEELEVSREKTSAKDYKEAGLRFHNHLVIDSSEEAIEKIISKFPKINCMVGDVTDDDVLEKANIKEVKYYLVKKFVTNQDLNYCT